MSACDAAGISAAPVGALETLRDVDTADDVNAWIESRFEAYADTGVYVPNELADVGWDLLKYSGYGSRPPKEDETRLPAGMKDYESD